MRMKFKKTEKKLGKKYLISQKMAVQLSHLSTQSLVLQSRDLRMRLVKLNTNLYSKAEEPTRDETSVPIH